MKNVVFDSRLGCLRHPSRALIASRSRSVAGYLSRSLRVSTGCVFHRIFIVDELLALKIYKWINSWSKYLCSFLRCFRKHAVDDGYDLGFGPFLFLLLLSSHGLLFRFHSLQHVLASKCAPIPWASILLKVCSVFFHQVLPDGASGQNHAEGQYRICPKQTSLQNESCKNQHSCPFRCIPCTNGLLFHPTDCTRLSAPP